jgi:hypothetical protein
MKGIASISAKVRVPGYVILAGFFLATVVSGVTINTAIAAGPSEEVYPGAISYTKGSMDFFDCEQKKVVYYHYRTKDVVARVVEFYKNQGFTITRDDSMDTCCISKKSYVLAAQKSGAEVYVSIEDFWFDGETARLMDDTLISIASVTWPGK